MAAIQGGSSFKKRVYSVLQEVGVEEGANENTILLSKRVYAPSISNLTSSYILYYNPNTDEVSYGLATATTVATQLNTTQLLSQPNVDYFIPIVPLSQTDPVAQTVFTDTGLKFNPYYNSITCGQVNSYLNGPIQAADQSGLNATRYLTFINTFPGGGDLGADSDLRYLPSANALTCGTVIANLQGNANTASVASTVTVTEDNANATNYIPFVSGTSGNYGLKVDTQTSPLTYNPTNGTLTATTFSGIATNASTATTANNVNAISQSTSTSTWYPAFVSGVGSSVGINVDTAVTDNLTYVPSTSTLRCTVLNTNTVGNPSGNTIITTQNKIRLQSTVANTIISASSGGSSGLHLVLDIDNGTGTYTTYKIALLNA